MTAHATGAVPSRDDTAHPRIAPLDGVRGVAILAVMAFHFQPYGAMLAREPSRFPRAESALSDAINSGWAGVDLFFVLSGFLITGILYDMRGGKGYFRNFYARRALRIFPVYYGFLLTLFVVLPMMGVLAVSWRDHAWFWFYAGDLGVAVRGATLSGPGVDAAAHLWSLSIEEQFYLVWPAVVLTLRSRRRLMLTCVVLTACAFAWRCAMLTMSVDPGWTHRLAPGRLDALAIGSFLALAARSPADLALVRRYARPAAMASAALLAAHIVYTRDTTPFNTWTQTVGYLLFAVLSGAIVILAATEVSHTLLRRVLASDPLTILGRYSYCLYIVHWPVTLLLRHQLQQAGGLPVFLGLRFTAVLTFGLAAGATSFLLAWASWHLYESRFLRLKSRFTSERPTATGSLAHRPVRIAAPPLTEPKAESQRDAA